MTEEKKIEELKIEYVKVLEIKPYLKNSKKHTTKQVRQVANSIERFGWIQPIVLDKDKNIIAGHCRLEASILLELDVVPCLFKRELTEEEAVALRIADNKLNESAWNMEFTVIDLKTLSEELFELTGFKNNVISDFEEGKYTNKIVAPIYEPKNEKPELSELIEMEKVNKIIERITDSKLKDDEKSFLIFSAYRLIRFNYRKIADYYSNIENGEMKEIMEDLALVIIDYNKAIESGYVKLSNDLLIKKYDEE